MDVSEYRRQVEAEAKAAARIEPAYKKALRKAGRSGGRAAGHSQRRREMTICPSRLRCWQTLMPPTRRSLLHSRP